MRCGGVPAGAMQPHKATRRSRALPPISPSNAGFHIISSGMVSKSPRMTSRCRSDTAFDVRLSQVDSAFLRAVTKPGILLLLRIIIMPGPLMKGLSVSLEKIQDNFRRFGLLDDQVQFLKGWFEDTLPKAPIDRLAILRLDGDMYASTMDVLNALYYKVSKG